MAFPTTAAPTLSNFQAQFNGLTLGPGTGYQVTGITGLGDLPAVRTSDVNRPRDHGMFVGLNFMGGRDITYDFWANPAGTGLTLQAMMENLSTAVLPSVSTELPLWVQLPNLPCLGSMSRVIKHTLAMDIDYSASQLGKPSVMWHSTDPRLYSTPSTSTVGLPAPLGGLTFNATPNFTFGGGGTFGSIVAVNNGNVEMRPTFVISGGASGVTVPVVQNVTTGWILTFSNPGGTGVTLNAGDTLTVDTDLRTILYTASGSTTPQPRRNWLKSGSIWPDPVKGIAGLAPGSNTVEFSSSDSSASSGTLALSWASAYLI
jgi:hypothetical protein